MDLKLFVPWGAKHSPLVGTSRDINPCLTRNAKRQQFYLQDFTSMQGTEENPLIAYTFGEDKASTYGDNIMHYKGPRLSEG